MPSSVSGILAKYQIAPCDRLLEDVGRRAIYHPISSCVKSEWSFFVDTMEVDSGGLTCTTKQPSEFSPSPNERNKSTEKEINAPVFINHAAMAWHESRRKWVGDPSRRSQRITKDPVISWSTTYEELLSTTEPFSERIPLPEMVDFLVDIWQDEGPFD